MFTRILAATDGSAHADRAVRLAAHLAGAQGAELTVTAAVQSPLLADAGLECLERTFPEDARRARRILDEASVMIPLRVSATTCVSCGATAVDAILGEVALGGHDLVVMGSRGQGALRSALLGSASRGVVLRSPVPVLVARWDGAASAERRIRRILVAVDGNSLDTAMVLEHAVDIAVTEGAALTLMTVLSTPRGGGPGLSRLIDEEAVDAEELLEDARASIPDGVAVDEVVDWGSPASCILERVEDRSPDLVIVGSRGRGPLSSTMLGSVGRVVLQRCPVPVLVVRPPQAPARSERRLDAVHSAVDELTYRR
jgi:nucleotide-binding universal stress UspA family protein